MLMAILSIQVVKAQQHHEGEKMHNVNEITERPIVFHERQEETALISTKLDQAIATDEAR
jgi:hypothetical protein